MSETPSDFMDMGPTLQTTQAGDKPGGEERAPRPPRGRLSPQQGLPAPNRPPLCTDISISFFSTSPPSFCTALWHLKHFKSVNRFSWEDADILQSSFQPAMSFSLP